MRGLKTLLAALALAVAAGASAFEPFVVRDIRVEGLRRIAAGTVFNYLPIKVGERVDERRAAQAVRALFKTGFFADVRLARDGDVLVVEVVERPAIAEIKVSGNRDIDTEDLLAALKQIGFAKGRVFNRAILDRVEQELRRQYFARGKYGVRIRTTVTPLERNRVAVAIDIAEGKVARIRGINIVGNRAYSEKRLLKLFRLGTPGWLSFYTRNDRYAKEKLAGDLEKLRSWYQDRGYLNFEIESTQVTITPDRKGVYITINVREGERYTVGQVKLAGRLPVPAAELEPLISVRSGAVFSRKELAESAKRIVERLGDEGYAFANVNTIPDVDREHRRVSVTFFVDPGKRVYVRRILFKGNYRTRDEVLRRELRQLEGAPFSAKKVRLSRTRLERLGFFQEVNVETPAVPGTTDQVDVVFTVTERPAGSMLAGLGYSQSQGLIFNASVTQDNFLGTGKRVSVSFNNSDVNTIYSFAYLNPYYTVDGVSRGFRVTYRNTDAEQAGIADYATNVAGGEVNYGLPLSEFDRVRLALGFDRLSVDLGSEASTEVTSFLAANGDSYNLFKLSLGWSRDSRNRAIFPDRGAMQSVSAELVLPGSTLQYYKLRYIHDRYFPLTRRFTLRARGELGYGGGYGDTDELPFFANFFAGGIRSVRGYQANSLGPRDSNGRPLGGAFLATGRLELIFPPPLGQAAQTVRLSGFVDAGNVFATVSDLDTAELRYSVGATLQWMSPLGPLAFSLAAPLNAQSGDDTQVFQFTFGRSF